MKILLLSDVHGRFNVMDKILEENKDVDVKMYLGDFQTSKHKQQELANKFDFVVTGNNDYPGISEKNLIVDLDGVKIFMTHGDRYFTMKEYVTKDWIAQDAKKHGATIAIHGHDHKASISEHDGVTVFNPGSPTFPRFGAKAAYGIMEIENGKVTRMENILVKKAY